MIRPEQERVKKLLTEAVTLLCRNSLQFEEEVCVEGLIGITLDRQDILLVSIHESIQNALRDVSSSGVRHEKDISAPSSPGKRKRRRRSRDSDTESLHAPVTPPIKKPAPSPIADRNNEHSEPEPRLSQVKKERSEDNGEDRHQEDDSRNRNQDFDGRRIHPANDPSISRITPAQGNSANVSSFKQEQSDNNQTSSSSYNQTSSRSSQQNAPHEQSDSGGVRVKEEIEEEEGEECFVIDSDEEDMSVMSDGSQQNNMSLNALENQLQMAAQNWPTVDGNNAFPDIGDLSQSQNWGNQSFDMNQSMGANNSSMSFNMGGGPSPGTSQDGQRRGRYRRCPKCGIEVAWLNRHIRSVHLQQKDYGCSICGRMYKEKRTLMNHIMKKHAPHVHLADETNSEIVGKIMQQQQDDDK